MNIIFISTLCAVNCSCASFSPPCFTLCMSLFLFGKTRLKCSSYFFKQNTPSLHLEPSPLFSSESEPAKASLTMITKMIGLYTEPTQASWWFSVEISTFRFSSSTEPQRLQQKQMLNLLCQTFTFIFYKMPTFPSIAFCGKSPYLWIFTESFLCSLKLCCVFLSAHKCVISSLAFAGPKVRAEE